MRAAYWIAAVAVLAAAESASAQVAHYRGYNPFTGRAYSNTVARNPFTGATAARTNTVNPFTGTRTTRSAGYNPWTGTAHRTTAAYNPWTGRAGVRVGVRR
jgi:hypothetical protein